LVWHFKKYNFDSELAALEDSTKIKKIGLWAE
jgi:hypothetical protein